MCEARFRIALEVCPALLSYPEEAGVERAIDG